MYVLYRPYSTCLTLFKTLLVLFEEEVSNLANIETRGHFASFALRSLGGADQKTKPVWAFNLGTAFIMPRY